MRATSLWQPYASLIAAGLKDKETRHYAPPAKLVGQRIAIHAAKRVAPYVDEEVKDAICSIMPWANLPLGAVVCTAVLDSVRRVSFQRYARQVMTTSTGRSGLEYKGWVIPDAFGDFSTGRYLWYLRDVEPLPEPVPARGYQGWWEWDPNAHEEAVQ